MTSVLCPDSARRRIHRVVVLSQEMPERAAIPPARLPGRSASQPCDQGKTLPVVTRSAGPEGSFVRFLPHKYPAHPEDRHHPWSHSQVPTFSRPQNVRPLGLPSCVSSMCRQSCVLIRSRVICEGAPQGEARDFSPLFPCAHFWSRNILSISSSISGCSTDVLPSATGISRESRDMNLNGRIRLAFFPPDPIKYRFF